MAALAQGWDTFSAQVAIPTYDLTGIAIESGKIPTHRPPTTELNWVDFDRGPPARGARASERAFEENSNTVTTRIWSKMRGPKCA
jgi:hypothetical protein